jgi:hypothetical protein
MNWDDGFITDDMLNEIFSQLKKNILLEVFLDCCHSGTGLRGEGLGRPAELGPENQILPRYLPPPMDIVCRSDGEEDEFKATRGFASKTRSTLKHILWSGCMDNQTSADAYIKDAYNGAFTYYFCHHLRKTSGQLNRRQLLKRIRNSLRHNGYWQIPQLECSATAKKIRALTVRAKT